MKWQAGTAIFGCDRNHSLTDTVERHYLIRFENRNSCTSRRKIILIQENKKTLASNEQLESGTHPRICAITEDMPEASNEESAN
jgi:hypothetical protein